MLIALFKMVPASMLAAWKGLIQLITDLVYLRVGQLESLHGEQEDWMP